MAKDKISMEAAAIGEAGGAHITDNRTRRRAMPPIDAALTPSGESDPGKKAKKGSILGKIGRSGKTGRRNRKSRRLMRLLIIVFAALLIIAAAVFVVIRNYFGVRDGMFDAVYSLDPRERAHEKVIAEKSKELDRRKEMLDGREDEIERREEDLYMREDAVRDDEDQLEKLRRQLAEQSLDLELREQERVPRYLQPMTEEQLADMQRLAKIYAAMSSEDAAERIMSLYEPQDMAAILYQMADKSAAAILAAMDAEIAAEITRVLMYE